jgi:hypothetical protein
MAEEPAVHASGTSPEEVAFRLMRLIQGGPYPQQGVNKNEVLDLYAECLMTVRSPQSRKKTHKTA